MERSVGKVAGARKWLNEFECVGNEGKVTLLGKGVTGVGDRLLEVMGSVSDMEVVGEEGVHVR